MYSKITHSIVEEHFDGVPLEQTKKVMGLYDNVLPENTSKGIELRQNSRDLFTQYDSALKDYIHSNTSANAGDPALIKNYIDNDLSQYFSNVITGDWYQIIRALPVINGWKTMITDFLSVIDAIVAKQDYTPAVDKARADIDALAKDMVTLSMPTGNPQWTVPGTSDLLNSYLDDIVQETVSRIAQNWPKNQASALSAYKKLVTGASPNQTGLADVISLGIIRQAPYSFQPTTS